MDKAFSTRDKSTPYEVVYDHRNDNTMYKTVHNIAVNQLEVKNNTCWNNIRDNRSPQGKLD